MTGLLTVEQMRENVARSRVHLAKQEAIVADLTANGHEVTAQTARMLLETMRDHFALEVEMLERMEADSRDG